MVEKARTDPSRRGVEVSSFLKRLRHALERRSMSQAELARALDVGEATVSEWFTRGRVPQGDVFLRLPQVLGLNGHWLLTGDGPEDLEDVDGDAYRSGARAVLKTVSDCVIDTARHHGIEDVARDELGRGTR